MLLKHTALYFVARGLPAAASFLAIAIYTRLLPAEEYGQYVLAVAGAALAEAVLFQWLSLGVLRFFPTMPNRSAVLLATVKRGFIVPSLLTCALTAIAATVWHSQLAVTLSLLAGALAIAQAWFNVNLCYFNSRLTPRRYGLFASVRAWAAVAIGSVLIVAGGGAWGPVAGLLLASVLVTFGLGFARRTWGAGPANPDSVLLRDLKRYGYPLALTVALNYVAGYADRFLISGFLGSQETGLYAAGYDLAQQTLGVIMLMVNLAGFPLVVHALEKQGVDAARNQLKEHSMMLLALGVPAAAGFIMLAPNIAHVVLGEEFRTTATKLIPWIAMASIFTGFKAYYLDMAFQLGRSTWGQVRVSLAAAVINLILNVWWIPLFGLKGAAFAFVVSAIVACVFSAWLGHRIFKLPALPASLWKVGLATAVMAAVLWPVRYYLGIPFLLGQIVLGGVVYGGCLFALGGFPRYSSIRTLWRK